MRKIKNQVWDAKSDASISFSNADSSNLALIIENDLVQESLTRLLEQLPNKPDIFYQSKIEDYQFQDQFVNLKLNSRRTLKTKLLIGSDGANSLVRQKSNLPIIKWNYDQTAIVATLKLADVKIFFYYFRLSFFVKFFFAFPQKRKLTM